MQARLSTDELLIALGIYSSQYTPHRKVQLVHIFTQAANMIRNLLLHGSSRRYCLYLGAELQLTENADSIMEDVIASVFFLFFPFCYYCCFFL